MKERAKIDQELCTHVKILLAGGATGLQAAKITNTSSGTVSRIKAAGFDYQKFMENTEKRRMADNAVKQAEKKPEQMQVELVYDPGIAEEYRQEQEQKAEMSEQTKMMRFQAAQVERIAQKLEKLNDTMNMILRCIRRE